MNSTNKTGMGSLKNVHFVPATAIKLKEWKKLIKLSPKAFINKGNTTFEISLNHNLPRIKRKNLIKLLKLKHKIFQQ